MASDKMIGGCMNLLAPFLRAIGVEAYCWMWELKSTSWPLRKHLIRSSIVCSITVLLHLELVRFFMGVVGRVAAARSVICLVQ